MCGLGQNSSAILHPRSHQGGAAGPTGKAPLRDPLEGRKHRDKLGGLCGLCDFSVFGGGQLVKARGGLQRRWSEDSALGERSRAGPWLVVHFPDLSQRPE